MLGLGLAIPDIVTRGGVALAPRDIFVDATTGNDGNSGLAANDAWQTIGKLNSETMRAGDVVTLSGTFTDAGIVAQSGVTYKADGAPAELNFMQNALGNAVDWTNTGTNRWARAFTFSDTTKMTVVQTVGGVTSAMNTIKASAAAVAAPGDWYFTAGTLTVYSPTAVNPTAHYSALQVNSNSIGSGFEADTTSNVTVRNIRAIGPRDQGFIFQVSSGFLGEDLYTQYGGRACYYVDAASGVLRRITGLDNSCGASGSGQHGLIIRDTSLPGVHQTVLVEDGFFDNNQEDSIQVLCDGDITLRRCRGTGNAENALDIKKSTTLTLEQCYLQSAIDHVITVQGSASNLVVKDSCLNTHSTGRVANMQESNRANGSRITSQRNGWYGGSTNPLFNSFGSGGHHKFESDIFVRPGGGTTNAVLGGNTGKRSMTQCSVIALGTGCRAMQNNGFQYTIQSLAHDGSNDGSGNAVATLVVNQASAYLGVGVTLVLSGFGDVDWNRTIVTDTAVVTPATALTTVTFKVPNAISQNPVLTGGICVSAPIYGTMENCFVAGAGNTTAGIGILNKTTSAAPLNTGLVEDETHALYILEGSGADGAVYYNTVHTIANCLVDGAGLDAASGGLWGGSGWKGRDLEAAAQTEYEEFAVSSLVVAGGVATVTTAVAHNFTAGKRVCILGATPVTLNGWSFIETVADTTHFTFKALRGLADQTATGTITCTQLHPTATGEIRIGAPTTWAPALMIENKDFNGIPFANDASRSWGAVQRAA